MFLGSWVHYNFYQNLITWRVNIWKSSWVISVNLYGESETYHMLEFRDCNLNGLYIIHKSLCFKYVIRIQGMCETGNLSLYFLLYVYLPQDLGLLEEGIKYCFVLMYLFVCFSWAHLFVNLRVGILSEASKWKTIKLENYPGVKSLEWRNASNKFSMSINYKW